MSTSLLPLAEAVCVPILGCAVGFPIALGYVLSWPLSNENLAFGLLSGGLWGAVGALLVVSFTSAVPASRRHWIAIGGSIIWTAYSTLWFFMHIALTAGC